MVTRAKFMPTEHFTKRWLRSRAHPDLGYGYCLEKRDGLYLLVFVDVPKVQTQRVCVDPDDLIDEPLPTGTRVWVENTAYPPFGWDAGHVKRVLQVKRYSIAFVDMSVEKAYPEHQFRVRWARPLQDPSVAVAHGLTESPVYHEARSQLLTDLIRQRQLARGLPAVMSAPVGLYHHQVDTAARVLADPVVRYLLADEVGLGKTIEAGLVIRQMLMDDPGLRVLVTVPESLVGQWHSELSSRLGLTDDIGQGRIRIIPHATVGPHPDFSPFGLLVVDEAHQLLKHTPEGSVAYRIIQKVPALLALSATPMRGDRDVFRGLLGLVDPVSFGTILEPSSTCEWMSVSNLRVMYRRSRRSERVDAKSAKLSRRCSRRTVEIRGSRA